MPRRTACRGSWHAAPRTGVFYTLLGLAGFLVTFNVPFAGPEGAQLVGMSLNSLANLVHVAIGVTGILAWRRLVWAIRYGWLLAAAMALLFLWGALVADDSPANLLAMDNSINGVHGITAVYGVAMAIWPGGQAQTAPAVSRARGRKDPSDPPAR